MNASIMPSPRLNSLLSRIKDELREAKYRSKYYARLGTSPILQGSSAVTLVPLIEIVAEERFKATSVAEMHPYFSGFSETGYLRIDMLKEKTGVEAALVNSAIRIGYDTGLRYI